MSAPCGTGAERVLWTQKRGGAWGIARRTGAECAQWAQITRRNVGNRKERLRDYASFPGLRDYARSPDGHSESALENVKERLRDYYVSREK